MKVAIYDDPGYMCLPWNEDYQEGGYFIYDLKVSYDRRISAVIEGLSDLNLPGVIAHISLPFEEKFWVQFTTAPKEVDRKGLPIFVDGGEINILHLWYSAYYYFDDIQNWSDDVAESFFDEFCSKNNSEFWSSHFLKKLREARLRAFEKIEVDRLRLQKRYESFSLIS